MLVSTLKMSYACAFIGDERHGAFIACVSLHSIYTLREEFSQTNVILQYKLLAAIVSAVCSVIQQL